MKSPFLAVMSIIGLVALPSSALAQTKTIKACQDEWRANRVAMQAAGKTEKAYVNECRAGTTSAQPTIPAPSRPPTSTTAAPSRPAGPVAAPIRPSAPPNTAGQYATEAEAKAHCARDLVVWANLNSNIFHFSGSKSYGKTKSGAYMCEKDAVSGGIRAAKNEKRPAGA